MNILTYAAQLTVVVLAASTCAGPQVTAPPADVSNPPSNVVSPPESIDPVKQTATGFFWPTGKEYLGTNNFHDNGCPNTGGHYWEGYIHIGTDIVSETYDNKLKYGEEVHAISAGVIKQISHNSGWWGTKTDNGNVGVYVEHYLADGTPFTVIYGHIAGSTLKVEDRGEKAIVTAGQVIGKIGPYDLGVPHLHFGISPQILTKIPDPGQLGTLLCGKHNPADINDTNSFENPIDWIKTRRPGPIPEKSKQSSLQIVPPAYAAEGETGEIQTHGVPPDPTSTQIQVATSTQSVQELPQGTLDRSNLISVIRWIITSVKNKDAQAISKLVTDDSIGYAIYTEGSQPTNAQGFVNDLTKRFPSSPKCDGVTYTDTGNDAQVWTSGWLPVWQVDTICYMDCSQLKQPVQSQDIGFYLRNQGGNWALSSLIIANPVSWQMTTKSFDLSTMKSCESVMSTSGN